MHSNAFVHNMVMLSVCDPLDVKFVDLNMTESATCSPDIADKSLES